MTCKGAIEGRFRRGRGQIRGDVRKDGRWLENGDECGILKIRYGDAPLLNIALTWSKIPLLPWITDAVAYLKKIKAI